MDYRTSYQKHSRNEGGTIASEKKCFTAEKIERFEYNIKPQEKKKMVLLNTDPITCIVILSPAILKKILTADKTKPYTVGSNETVKMHSTQTHRTEMICYTITMKIATNS